MPWKASGSIPNAVVDSSQEITDHRPRVHSYKIESGERLSARTTGTSTGSRYIQVATLQVVISSVGLDRASRYCSDRATTRTRTSATGWRLPAERECL
eukprot:scaffold409522_cov19-Prasinocladus_malaysianus.AAC.1